MTPSALLIGTVATCDQLQSQLALLSSPPRLLGCVLAGPDASAFIATPQSGLPILGAVDDLHAIVTEHKPDLGLVTLPAVMHAQVQQIRTTLRQLRVPDRFMPTLEDQLEGVGPRTQMDIDLTELIARPKRGIDQEAVRDIIENKRVLITGAGGSIGSELARIVARLNPAQLVCVDRSENALFEIDRQIAREHPDLPRRALLHDVVESTLTLQHFVTLQPEVIFHAAAHKHVPMMEDHPKAAVENNLYGTKSVVDAAHVVGAERFVMISTDKAVNPSSIMGATKRMAEQYVQHIDRRSSTSFSIVRFGNVLGSSGSVLETWGRQIADGGPLTVTDPAMTRYFMTIHEAASLVIQAAALHDPASPYGEVFLLDMGDPIRILDLACRFIEQNGLTPRLPDQPGASTNGFTMPIVFSGARPGEKLHEELAFDAESMRATSHSGIHIWEVPIPNEHEINRILNKLSGVSYQDPPALIARTIRQLVPEMTDPVSV